MHRFANPARFLKIAKPVTAWLLVLGALLTGIGVVGALFIMALRGLSHPETSRRGNQLGMAGMALGSVKVRGIGLGTAGTAGYHVLAARRGAPNHARGPHRPHFQEVVHNSLNGGVERWFAPMEDAVADGPTLRALLDLGRGLADALHPGQDWFTEAHQFRIEAAAGAPGFPTPEGVHHDGVDAVLIAMVARRNLEGGETLVADAAGAELARFVLTDRLDTALLDDRRVRHGVSPVRPADPALPSRRDVLVLTWKRGFPPPRD